MRPVVDLDSLEQTASGNVVGGIRFELCSGPFPDPLWSDFPVVLLTWWSNATDRLLSGASNREELDFMEGPLKVVVTTSPEGGRYEALGLADELQGQCDVPELAAALERLSKATVQRCRELGWSAGVIERLAARL